MKIIRKTYNLQSLNIFKDCNLNIALYGGSFNPAHPGHLSLSKVALNTFGFDFVWWLVAKQNPFKENYNSDIFIRAESALKIANHPRILVSTAENDIGSNFTFDTVKFLRNRFNNINFTWLMGGDNMQFFHKWKKSQEILNLCKIIVFNRPGSLKYFSSFNLKYKPIIDKKQREGIIFYRHFMSTFSSTQIRQQHNDKRH